MDAIESGLTHNILQQDLKMQMEHCLMRVRY